MFDNEIRGQLATLMGGRAAEELTCGHLSTGKCLKLLTQQAADAEQQLIAHKVAIRFQSGIYSSSLFD